MDRRFESHGLEFFVDAVGFGNKTEDFRATCDLIEAKLDAMDAAEVQRLHRADIRAIKNDGECPPELAKIAVFAASEITQHWHNSDSICITLNAIQS